MKKVLIVEDDQIVGSIYRRKFQAEGFTVELATDGEKGLEAVASFAPDIVILDLMLPRLNGVEVLRRMRSQPGTATLPVIVLSNAYLSNLVQDAAAAGANQCLIKASCTPKQVVDVIHRVLRGDPTTPASPTPSPTPANPAPVAQPPPTTAPVPAKPAPAPQAGPDEATYQAELRQAFLKTSNDTLAQLRTLLQSFVKSEGDAARLPNLFALYRRVHSITSNAGVAGLTRIARLCSALEALLKELYEKPKNINASTIRTIAQTIDFVGSLFGHSTTVDTDPTEAPKIIVVDDEPISRRAVVYALEKANLKSTSIDTPENALPLLEQNRYDLIFLDIDMPQMSGFDLCTRLRTFPSNAKTPVIFVTGLTDFESRTRSTLSGGNDLIAKPFLFMELAVKATSHILRGQIAAASP